MDNNILERVNHWLEGPYDETDKAEIRRMMREDEKELSESFYRDLEFGTGGLRGIMGVGSNRMNRYTVGTATQGLANYLKLSFPAADLKVAIAHDSRNHSRDFAEVAAAVLSANDIDCYLFEALRPTPELSFTVRHLNCHAGIVVTASHNPKEYNGYKVYWQDGGQLVPPHDKNIMTEVGKISSIDEVKWQKKTGKIHSIGKEVDEVYLTKIKNLSLNPQTIAEQKNLSIVYTPLHGTGITLVPKALQLFGFQNVTILEKQATPDGDFPTVASPNPEEKTAMEMVLQKAKEIDADLVLATDPDADRMGIAAKDHHGEWQLFNGNMTASLLVHYILSQKARETDFKDKFIVKTIVTTELINAMAQDFAIDCEDVLTGFKYIAEQIRKFEGKKEFLVGGEESYGTLVSDFVRDKDAVSACCMIAELAAVLKSQGRSLFDLLLQLYQKYGLYKTELLSLTKKGQDGVKEIADMMKHFRECPPQALENYKILKIKDFKTQKTYYPQNNKEEDILLPSSNVLQFFTEEGDKITVRPSGTEPKIKFYFEVRSDLQKAADFDEISAKLSEKIEIFKQFMINY